jgi:hypothetical protein
VKTEIDLNSRPELLLVIGAIVSGTVEGLINQGVSVDFLLGHQWLSWLIRLAPILLFALFTFIIIRQQKKATRAEINVLALMGWKESVPELENSLYEPSQCIKQTSRTLYFIGTFGSKWVMTDHSLSDLRIFLSRINAKDGEARFLLMNPASPAFQQLQIFRGGRVDPHPLQIWKMLCDEYPCLDVRLYSHIPFFRFILIDHRTLVLSRYKDGDVESKAVDLGWKAPQLVFGAEAPWSLYDAFELYFLKEWRSAISIKNTAPPSLPISPS